MADETNVASATDTPSGEQIVVSNNVVITPEIQAIIDKAHAERKAANEEAARYRIEKKQRDEQELAAQGKLTELNGQLQKERDELNLKLAQFESENNTTKAKLLEIENARRAELLAKLPQDKAATYGTIDIGLLEQITKDFSQTVTPTSLGADRGAGNTRPTTLIDTPSVPFAGSHSSVINVLERILTQ